MSSALGVAAAVSVLGPGSAWANGSFPTATQLIAEPGAPSHLLLRSTFGLIFSMDAGKSWDWLCEDALSYADAASGVSLLEPNTLVVGAQTGVVSGRLGACDFPMVTETGTSVVDFVVSRGTAGDILALAEDYTVDSFQVWESTDGAASFVPITDVIPHFIATTLDVAPSDPDVLYVSGADVLSDAQGQLMRSDDHGKTFVAHEVPDSVGFNWPYIGAIDPQRPDTIYVRLSGTPGRLKVSHDGGVGFTEPIQLDSELQAFALSPDGQTLLVGSPTSGTFRADTDSLTFERVACRGVGCLLWNSAGVFACADELNDGFSVGRLLDQGTTYERLLAFSCLQPTLACSDTTSVGSLCSTAWSSVEEQLLSVSECNPDAALPPVSTDCLAGGSTETAGAAGTAGSSSSEAGSSQANAGGAGAGAVGTDGGGVSEGTTSKGCACSLGRDNSPRTAWLLGASLLLGVARRRGFLRRRSARPRARRAR